MNNKPQLSFWQIWNMCFGFFGIQFGFALQNSNVSRIFQTLGAEVDKIPGLWVAAPLTGLLVQPLVGYFSDRSQSRFGRRKPYFVIGAVCTTAALVVMPSSPSLWIAAGTLWVLDASLNISMEPFRAFVGDMLPEKQRPFGYTLQSFFIGMGAIIASALPWMFTNIFNVSNTAEMGQVPESVRFAFYAGAFILFSSVMWTVFRSKEYSQEELAAFGQEPLSASNYDESVGKNGLLWLIVGIVGTLAIALLSFRKELYIISLCLLAYGALLIYVRAQQKNKQTDGMLFQIIYDLDNMPVLMRKLALVQFFSWFALFAMWIYGTAAVSSYHYGSSDTASKLYNDGADWAGILFSAYNGFAAIAALLIPMLVRKFGAKNSHAIALLLGAAGFLSFFVIQEPKLLLVSMVGVGFAWASILSLPYALLSNVIPAQKMGVYMGIFNFFIVIPQILAASILGLLIKFVFAEQAIYAFLIAALCWIVAAIYMFKIKLVE